MCPVLRTRDIPVHPEPPVQPPDLAAAHPLRHERLHPRPEAPTELLINNPVEIMRKHAVLRSTRAVPTRPHRRIRREPDALCGADDPVTLVRGQDVAQEVQTRHGRVRVVRCPGGTGRRGRREGDGAVLGCVDGRWVLVGRVPLRAGDSLDHAELRPQPGRHRGRQRPVQHRVVDHPPRVAGRAEVPRRPDGERACWLLG